MKKVLLALSILIGASSLVVAQDITYVGGEPMYPTKDIVDNAVNSKDHTTLVAAVKAAGLVETLKTSGPFTVFAPTNDAFENLPEGTVSTLLKPENKQLLTTILTYHVLSGKYTAESLMKEVQFSGGKKKFKTVAGAKIEVSTNGNNLMITDENGNTANITVKDVIQSNGVIHVIDAVITPKQ
ncbi:MAG: fasciclin domain-containing protein [Luteibaculum sp.]